MGSQVHMYGDEGRGPKDVWLVVSRGVFVYIRLHILHVPVWAAPCPHVTRIPYNSRRSSEGRGRRVRAQRLAGTHLLSYPDVICRIRRAQEFLKHAGLEQVDAVGGSETLRTM